MFARFLMALALLAGAAQAETLDERLLAVSERINKAQSYADTGGGLQLDELSALAEELEVVLGEMRQVEREYNTQRTAIEERFYEDGTELMQLIGFVTTFESQPAPDFILHPAGPRASVEANIIVSGLMAQMETQLADVATDLKIWRDVTREEDALFETAAVAFADVNRLRGDILRAQGEQEPVSKTEEPMVLDALFAVSTNLNDFVQGLDQIEMTNKPETVFSMERAKGTLELPVKGTPQAYRNGIRVLTNDSFVTTPVSGTVRFEANFLDYGHTLIIEPEKDYLIVLAGMENSAVEEGDLIKAGDVVGFMASDEEENAENASSALRTPEKSLYVETRYQTAPIPAMEFFANEN